MFSIFQSSFLGVVAMEKLHLHLPLPKSLRCNSEWVFRDVPGDITIDVDGTTFSLHKFPLVTRSGRIRKLVAENKNSARSRIELHNLPGGAETFDLAAKFCYSANFEITSQNVAQLYCISHYLEMTEDFSKDNLVSRAREYFEKVVCKSLEMCIEVLQQCDNQKLLPFADELKIITRCIDSIASKACVEQIASSFSTLEYSSSGSLLHMNRQTKSEVDWWIQDLSVLEINMYQKVVSTMKCRGVRAENIGASLVNYAHKEFTKKHSSSSSSSNKNERIIIETIVWLLPVEKFAVPISFLFGLLRSAVMVDCTVACRLDLERRIGSQLDIATLDDLLIPSFRNSGDTLFDVDTVHRILVNFSQHDIDNTDDDDDDDDLEHNSAFESDIHSPLPSPSQTALFKVSRLVDNYLAEIAADTNLKLNKFIAIAESLPAHSRAIHDGLYRAIDVYLKAHQDLSDLDKMKLCKMIDFQKLSQEAGAHAAQNERLPLQSIVQVLYFEQMRLRNAMLSVSYNGVEDDHSHYSKPLSMHHQPWRISTSGALSAGMSPRDNYASLRQENRGLKLELARLRMRLNDLEKDHVCMKKNMERSNTQSFMITFSKKIGKFMFFGNTSLRGSTNSSSRQSQRSDSKNTDIIHEYST